MYNVLLIELIVFGKLII